MSGPAAPRRPADGIDFASLRSVLVIMLRHHGDVLLTSPLHAALKAAAPQVEIDALIYRETAPMLAGSPHLTRIHAIDRAWKTAGARAHASAEWRLLRELRERRYDLVIHLTDHRRGAWMVRALAPRHAVAPRSRDETGIAGRFWRSTFTHRYANASSVPPGAALARRHTVEQNLDALRRLGLRIDPPPPLTMVAGEAGERDADALLARLGVDGPFHRDAADLALVVQVLERRAQRRVDREPVASRRDRAAVLRTRRARAVDDRGHRRGAAGVARRAAGTPGAGRRRRHARTPRRDHRSREAVRRHRLGADAHRGGRRHAGWSRCSGRPASSNWGPWRVAHRIVTSDVDPCRPCGLDGCGSGKVSECLVRIPVHAVLAAIDDLMREVDDASDPLRFA